MQWRKYSIQKIFSGKNITAKVLLEIIFIKCFRKAVQLLLHYIYVCNIFKANLPCQLKKGKINLVSVRKLWVEENWFPICNINFQDLWVEENWFLICNITLGKVFTTLWNWNQECNQRPVEQVYWAGHWYSMLTSWFTDN